MLERLNGYDWDEVFKYANPSQILGTETKVNTNSFDREDIEEIIAIDDGENDGEGWLGVFKLKDGRYAMIEAWCDYTGWG